MNSQEEEKYTLEQIKEIKEKMISKWESDLPFLTKQLEYERVITELDELQMRRAYAKRKLADIMAAPPDQDDIVPKHERKLKKEPV